MAKSKSPKGQGRGRPALSDEQVADMKAHISSCALRLYQSEGFEAVSMRKLAAEAGCTVMTLYRYFDRKIDILRHLWDDIFAELFDHLETIAKKEKRAEARLKAVCLAYVVYWLKHREHYFLVFMSSDVSQSDVSIFVDEGRSVERFALIYSCLEDAVKYDIDPEELNLKSQALLCALNGTAHNLITISGFAWATPKRLVEVAVSGILEAAAPG